MYRIGSLRHSSAVLYNMDQVAWSNESINVLGIRITHGDVVHENYEGVLSKVRKILGNWENRSLTLTGKVLVVNSLVMSLFVYKMMVLPMMPEKIVKQVNGEIRNYLWKGGKDKIAYDILRNPKHYGWLNLCNLKFKEIALKATWPAILLSEKEYAQMVYSLISPIVGEDIWRVSLRPEDVGCLNINNTFWRDVVRCWCEFNYWHESEVENQILWFNSRIRVNDQPFIWVDVKERGLKYVHQLYAAGKMKSQNELYEEFGLDTMRYNTLVISITKFWKESMQIITQGNFLPLKPHNLERYGSKRNFSRYVYQCLNGDPLLVHNKNYEVESGS